MLFTQRFIKDLILLFLFCIGFYFLTHNPLYYPTPTESTGAYSIELLQYPLILGVAGHNYLVLRDDTGNIIRELHGLATDNETNTWKYIGIKSGDLLKVWEFSSTENYIAQKSYAGITLMTGTKEETVTLWAKALVCKGKINQQDILYPPFGVNIGGDTENSNSVAYTLTLCMGLDAEHVGLFTPGSTKNLLEED